MANQVLEILKPLRGVCRGVPGADGLAVYAKHLADLEPDALRRAVERYLSESEDPWFPAIGKLRALAVESEIAGWQAAWDQIIVALGLWNRGEHFRAKELVSEAADHVARGVMGGLYFYNLSHADLSTRSVWQSNFRSAWEAEKKRAERNGRLPEHLRRGSVGIETGDSGRLSDAEAERQAKIERKAVEQRRALIEKHERRKQPRIAARPAVEIPDESKDLLRSAAAKAAEKFCVPGEGSK